MLRQLARLTRPLPAIGSRACALAVYANAEGELLAARESGDEGVACVDDVARGLALLCDLWAETRLVWVRRWAEGLLDFVLWMQAPSGHFVNFVHDWSGLRNTDGPTSTAGGGFWQARGMHGLAKAWLVLGDARAGEGFAHALARVRETEATPDVRAVHVAAALAVLRAGRMPELRDDLERWSAEIRALRDGDVLLNAPEDPDLHLWGHAQEGALAEAGRFLRRPDLVDAAARSAEIVFVPLIRTGFPLPLVQPYAVACAVFAMDRLRAATGEDRYGRLARDARAWFDGRNSASAPVRARARGCVYDGIDDGRLNTHSGAEANVVAAEALFEEAAHEVRAMSGSYAPVP